MSTTSAVATTQMSRWVELPGWVHPDPARDASIREAIRRQQHRHETDPSIARTYIRLHIAATHDRIRAAAPPPA